jgi:predicted DNA-binding transcriptional regulator AlpA
MSDEIRPRYLSVKGVAIYLSVSRGTVLSLVESGRLPKPVYLTPKLPRWDRDEIDRRMSPASEPKDWAAEIDAWFDRQEAKGSRKKKALDISGD